MRMSILACVLFTFLSVAPPTASQESRPQSRPSAQPPSAAELLALLSGHWRGRAVKQPNGETVSFSDYVVNEVLPGGRWFVSFSGGDGSEDTSWEFQAIELIPDTSSIAGVIVSGGMQDVRLLNGWIRGRHLIVNELSERRTYTLDGEVLMVDREQVDSTGRRIQEVDQNGRPRESAEIEKLVRVKRPRQLFEPANRVPAPRTKLEERLRELVGTWKPTGGKDLITGTPYRCAGEMNTLLPGGWIASVTQQAPDLVTITLMGVDPAGHAVVGVELASYRPTAALVSGYLEDDRLVTRISGGETVWKVEGSRMTQTRRAPAYGSGTKDRAIFELTKE